MVFWCSCEFTGTQEELAVHLKLCKYEGMKDFLGHMEEKMGELQESLEEKDQEINFLRSMLGKLSERLENLEKTAEIKLGQGRIYDYLYTTTTVEQCFMVSINIYRFPDIWIDSYFFFNSWIVFFS